MSLYDSKTYINSIVSAANTNIPWDDLRNKTIYISGATGLIGRYLIDVLMQKNRDGLGVNVIAASRNEEMAKSKLNENYFISHFFEYQALDVSKCKPNISHCDFVINLASNTHPVAYAKRPIETITTNFLGTKNLLDMCKDYIGCRFVLPSSVEIYGEMDTSLIPYEETMCGYLDSNTVRAGYPESKRVCEALCQAYITEHDTDVVIVRFPRVFGPTMGMSDSKAIAQFIKKAIMSEDIVLKSDGNQYYSFLYVQDAVIGMIKVMLGGDKGEAYNLSDESCDSTLKNAATICAQKCGRKVVFEYPDSIEKKGYSTATKAVLDGTKAKKLGWKCSYSINRGIEETIDILIESQIYN